MDGVRGSPMTDGSPEEPKPEESLGKWEGEGRGGRRGWSRGWQPQKGGCQGSDTASRTVRHP